MGTFTSRVSSWLSLLCDICGWLLKVHMTISYQKQRWCITNIHDFKSRVEWQFYLNMKYFQSGWGGEYQSLHKYLTSQWITHTVSCPHTPTQNGTTERKHWHLVETALSLLKHAYMPHKFWDEVATTTAFRINWMSTPLLHYKTPFQMIHHRI